VEVTRAHALALLLAIGAVSLTGAAQAQPAPPAQSEDAASAARTEAREANRKAIELSKTGDYAAALPLFQRAYDLSPSYIILYNIGRMSRFTGDPARSYRAFERYLREGGKDIEKARRAEVEKELASLKGLVGKITISVNKEGADLTIDGAPVVRPGEPIVVSPGSHKVTAVKQGSPLVEKDVDVTAGSTVKVELVLVEPANGDPKKTPTPPPVTPPGGTGGGSALPAIAWTATGVLTAGAIAVGVSALVISSDLEDDTFVGTNPHAPEGSDIDEKASTVGTLAIVTDILAGAAIVAGAFSIYFTITDSSDPPPESTKAPKTGRDGRPFVQRATVGLGPGGLVLSGSF
jgi:PEGA domain